jgi:NAD(P)-dependent dehydrogenase (short-subunit alcohol dehydrogenase family)
VPIGSESWWREMTIDSSRRVIVTGAGSGIGLAIARRFSQGGASVHICDVNEAHLAQAVAETPCLRAAVADVSDPAAVERMFDGALAEFGGSLDVLINNAGMAGPRAPIEATGVDDWDRTIRTNLSGAFYCLRHAASFMKAQGSGVVINISTASTRTGLPQRLAYVASKAGLEGLTRNAARELGPYGIRCNAILPGLVDNERGRALVRRLADDRGLAEAAAMEEFTAFVSMRTMIAMDEIADVAWFLASDQARHVTGQLIGVDGNMEWET